jgi:hypothetical protein
VPVAASTAPRARLRSRSALFFNAAINRQAVAGRSGRSYRVLCLEVDCSWNHSGWAKNSMGAMLPLYAQVMANICAAYPKDYILGDIRRVISHPLQITGNHERVQGL